MRSTVGMRFDDVRIHVTPHAHAIGALAFTQGSDIHFAPGHYNPATAHGRTMLAHELAHVAQQKSGRGGAIAACAQAKLATGVLQLRSSPTQFQRTDWARNWVKQWAKRSNMKDGWYNHLFLGLAMDGSRDPAHPTGFHTYAAAPGNIVYGTVGTITTSDAWKVTQIPFPPKVNGKAVTRDMLCEAFGIMKSWAMQQTGDTVYPVRT